jgi:hypothetical protein
MFHQICKCTTLLLRINFINIGVVLVVLVGRVKYGTQCWLWQCQMLSIGERNGAFLDVQMNSVCGMFLVKKGRNVG